MRALALGIAALLLIPVGVAAQTYGPSRRGPEFVRPDASSCPIELPPMSDVEALRFGNDQRARCEHYLSERRRADERDRTVRADAAATDALRRELLDGTDALVVDLYLALREDIGQGRSLYDSIVDVRGLRLPAQERRPLVLRLVDLVVHSALREAARRSGVTGAGGEGWESRFPRVRRRGDLRRIATALRAYERELASLLETITPEATITDGAIEAAALLGCARRSVQAARRAVAAAGSVIAGRRENDFARAIAEVRPTCSAPEQLVTGLSVILMQDVTHRLRPNGPAQATGR